MGIKDYAAQLVAEQLLNNINMFSDDSLIRLTILAEKLGNESDKKAIKAVREKWEKKHPSTVLVKNLMEKLSKNCKEKLVKNLFINAIFSGTKKRKEFQAKEGFYPPWLLVISPSTRCNLNCIGCYAGEYTKMEELDFETVDRIITEAKEMGIYFITISGGEPLMWPHLFKIFEKHNDVYFQFYTNSTLITEEIAKKLAELGNAAPAISVEGFEAETDFRRGKGTHAKIMKAMENLKKAGVMFGFSATPTIKNSDILCTDKFIDFYLDKGVSFGWYFQYIPIGRKPDTSLMATPEQRNRLRIRVGEIRNTKPIFIGDFWNDGPYVHGCLAGGRPGGYLHINCRGDIEPCVFFQFSVDNIKNKTLKEALSSKFFKAIREEQPYCANKNLMTPCAIIDNPEAMRKVIKECNAKPSYNSSMAIIEDPKVIKDLDNYSKEYKKITDPIWEKELSKRFKHWKDCEQNK